MPNLRKFLFENEAVVGIRTPTDYMYMKVLGYTLSVINSWPLKEIGRYEPRALALSIRGLHFFLWLTLVIASVAYIVIHNSSLSFFEIGHVYVQLFMGWLMMARLLMLTCVPRYRDVAKEFLTKIHLFFYKDHSEYAMKTHKRVHVISHLFTLYLLYLMIVGAFLFNAIPMYSNYSAGRYKSGGSENSSFEHSLYYSYPFNVSTSVNGYIFACILHWIVSYLSSIWFCMFDLFLSLMVLNLWGHFKILLYNLNNFPRPCSKSNLMLENSHIIISTEMYSESELLNINKKLKECIEYHRDIVHFTNKISNVFGPVLFAYYMYHQACCCLLLLECSQMTTEALLRYLPLTVIIFQALIQTSTIFELVGSTSQKLKDAVYGVPWECMDAKNRKIVLFFLMNVQEPVHVKALGVANVGVTSMATILKTSLSYFTFLRSF